MKAIATILVWLVSVTGFSQNSTSLLFSYLNTQPQNVNSCYTASPATVVKTKVDQILFQSTDGGTTWIDLSAGLPKGTEGSRILAKDGGMYLGTKDGKLYHTADLQSVNWELQDIHIAARERFFTGIFDLPTGLYTTVFEEGVYKLEPGTNSWKPVYESLEEKTIFSMHETPAGNILAGTGSGMYISKDKGKSWERVYTGWINNIVYNSNTWLANSADGLIISTDDGEHWTTSLKEAGFNFQINVIDGYFVALRMTGSYYKNNGFHLPSVIVSSDEGITWQNMESGKPDDSQITDLEKSDKYLFSSRAAGISRSSDMGKTWQLLIAPPDKFDPWQFDLMIHENTLFALMKWGGC